MKNFVYQTSNLARYFLSHRNCWDHFYESERKVFDYVRPTENSRVLDMGCAAGGLGVALKQRFGISQYTGVDINAECIEVARRQCSWGEFFAADFLDVGSQLNSNYDLCVSLSCADWNVKTDALLHALFRRLKPNGHLLMSCRLTNKSDVIECVEARQRVTFEDIAEDGIEEFAPYKLYRLEYILRLFKSLGAIDEIYGYGYQGSIPKNVVGLTFSDAFYIVFAIRKAQQENETLPRVKLDVDTGIFT